MTDSDKKFLAIMPKMNSQRVDMLLDDVIGCRWTISVLGAVAKGVRRPGALERHIEGISTKVLTDRLRRFTRAGFLSGSGSPKFHRASNTDSLISAGNSCACLRRSKSCKQSSTAREGRGPL